MDPTRIAALLKPYLDGDLTPRQLDQISTYIDLLLRWNARINLTAIRDPEEIVTRHFGESFFMARHLFSPSNPCHPEQSSLFGEANQAAKSKTGPDLVEEPALSLSKGDPSISSPLAIVERAFLPALPSTNEDSSDPHVTRGSHNLASLPVDPRVIDLGSGAGFPALPLKIWAPKIRLRLIESNHKKAAFLREAARALTLTNVDVIAERAETVSARLTPETQADVVTFRAVEKFDKILPVALTFLAPFARLALLISAAQLPKLESQPPTTWQAKHVPKSHELILAIGQFAPVDSKI